MTSKAMKKQYSMLDQLNASCSNITRKAEKKLREIDELKKKSDLSNEELKKISIEEYWQNILNEKELQKAEEEKRREYKKAQEKRKEERKQEREKRAEEEKQKVEEERKQKQKAEEEKRKEYKKEQEKQEQEYKTGEEKQKRKQEYKKFHKHNTKMFSNTQHHILEDFGNDKLALSIYQEYIDCMTNSSNKQTYRTLSMKYHPDKNPQKNTTFHQQVVQRIYSKFVEQKL
jgi:hypothetical protein